MTVANDALLVTLSRTCNNAMRSSYRGMSTPAPFRVPVSTTNERANQRTSEWIASTFSRFPNGRAISLAVRRKQCSRTRKSEASAGGVEWTVTPITQTYRPVGIRREIDVRPIATAASAFDASTLRCIDRCKHANQRVYVLQTARRTSRLKDTKVCAIIFLRRVKSRARQINLPYMSSVLYSF